MNKRIVLPVILVSFLVIGLVFVIGCGESELTPKMTAPEVCQYVKQALPNEYKYASSTRRYEFSYTALNAVSGKGVIDEASSKGLSPGVIQILKEQFPEGTWLVNVKVVAEPQQLSEGQWSFYPAGGSETSTAQYLFNEDTGALTKR